MSVSDAESFSVCVKNLPAFRAIGIDSIVITDIKEVLILLCNINIWREVRITGALASGE